MPQVRFIVKTLRDACLIIILVFTSLPLVAGPGGGADSASQKLVFISDTQAPIVFERLFLRSDRNTDATKALLQHILGERPQHVFLLGDLTSAGMLPGAWETMDAFLDSLRMLHIAADALLGNHEEMFSSEAGEKNFQLRFPEASRTGYCRTIDSVAVVMLNSNFDNLLPVEIGTQASWYARTMDSLDRDESVQAIIVCCHHSPYTNSTVVKSSAAVQERFLPLFSASRKTRLFLSGHAHAFEHFRRNDKDYFVIGGGGGLLHPLNNAEGRVEGDLAPSPRPRFHYLEITRTANRLKATVKALQDDHATVKDIACPLAGDEK